MRHVIRIIVFLLSIAVPPASIAQTRGGFDVYGHLLMNGIPRFVLGVYDSGGGYFTDEPSWVTQIFSPTGPRGLQDFRLNLYLEYTLGGMPIDATIALLNVLQNHGLMYLQTGNCFEDKSWLRPPGFSIASQTYVQLFAQRPAALGYYIMDECWDGTLSSDNGISLIPETQTHYQQLKNWDPQGISLATNLAAAYRDPSLWTNAADVLAIDPYPLYAAQLVPNGPLVEPPQGYPHFIVADFTAKLRAAARADRPIWSVLQFFQPNAESRLPTPGEMRAHAVMAIVEGAQGLFWWEIGAGGLRNEFSTLTSPSTWMGYLHDLTTELAGLEPALLGRLADKMLVRNTTRFSDPIQGRIQQLDHNVAVDVVSSRKQGYPGSYQTEKALLQMVPPDTSKSPLLYQAGNVRTRAKFAGGMGYVFAYNYTNLQQDVAFTWANSLVRVTESKSGHVYPRSGSSWSDTLGPYEARIYLMFGSVSHDFDGDRKSDILWQNTADGHVALWFMNGGTVVSTADLGLVPGWTPTVGHFNGDGNADILWHNTTDGHTVLWLMNGSTVIFNADLGYVAGWTPTVADFNGDGTADILWQNTTDGRAVLWFMRGVNVLSTADLGFVPGWTPTVGDINGDGRADILWQNTTDGHAVLWLMDGSTLLSSVDLGSAAGWRPTLGDFNGDGLTDILWQYTADGHAAMSLTGVLPGGGITFSNVDLGSVPGWTPTVSDFNGDGNADILWQKTADGNAMLWFMNGGNVVGTADLGFVPGWQPR